LGAAPTAGPELDHHARLSRQRALRQREAETFGVGEADGEGLFGEMPTWPSSTVRPLSMRSDTIRLAWPPCGGVKPVTATTTCGEAEAEQRRNLIASIRQVQDAVRLQMLSGKPLLRS
jgi:hypothetical protein